MEAAEEAAGAGNYVSAREYLRQAVALQEANVGPTDPFLANTLNNLGVVYEREGKPAEAEACYRRAYAVARAALAADHPFVVMSASNLREFCEARGLPFDRSSASPSALPPDADRLAQPPAPVAVAPIAPAAPDRMTAGAWPEPPAHPAADTARAEGSTSPVAPSPSMGRLVFAGLIIGGLIAIAAIVIQSRSTTRPSERTAAAAAARADRPKPAAGARAVPPLRKAAREQLPRAEAPAKVAASAPTLAAAELCRTLQTGDDWRCAPATGTLRPGVLFFYTRLLSQTDTTVQHRWYSGSRLHQSVTLRVHANSRAGYRTYSQMTVSPARAGDWRVELRAANGAVLHEERFTVGK
jgi:tetratricopeptide (TPR) repeat protein